MGREAWSAAGHEDTKSQTQLSDWTELNIYVMDLYSLMKGVTLSYIFKYFVLM